MQMREGGRTHSLKVNVTDMKWDLILFPEKVVENKNGNAKIPFLAVVSAESDWKAERICTLSSVNFAVIRAQVLMLARHSFTHSHTELGISSWPENVQHCVLIAKGQKSWSV